ncbi:MAG: hypothetical protein ACPL07_02430 [Candidatus Bathyarchaeia archaeon]
MVSREAEKKAERVTINLDEVIVRSDGSRITMREFVKEMLFYNPDFRIETSKSGRIWYIKRRRKID